MENQTAVLYITLSDVEKSKSRSIRYWVVADLYMTVLYSSGIYFHFHFAEIYVKTYLKH